MFTIGIVYASSALIGKFIGSGEVLKAKQYLMVLTALGFGLSVL